MFETHSNGKAESRKPIRFAKRAFVVLVISLVLFAVLAQVGRRLLYSSELKTTTMRLVSIRAGIKEFKEEVGRYPNSLAEMSKYGEEHPETSLKKTLGAEFISDTKGNTQEHPALDGKGGWHYNKETGEVKVNLTEPLKHYLQSYFGPDRNEIPSHW